MWEPYRDHIPAEERHDYITAYHKRLVSDDEDVRLKAAIAWTTWEKVFLNII
jgi:proline iminopeptidase